MTEVGDSGPGYGRRVQTSGEGAESRGEAFQGDNRQAYTPRIRPVDQKKLAAECVILAQRMAGSGGTLKIKTTVID